MPSLESPQCTEARDTVKQFYSWHLGTDADVKAGHPEIYKKYVSSEFLTTDRGSNWESDPYFLSLNSPKTFKIGTCKQIDQQKVDLQVQLYWRDNEKVTQKEVHVEAVKTGDTWLINKVSN